MNRFSVALLISLALLSKESLAADKSDCCLCNDCDMMMKPDSQVYDIDEDKLISCSDFAEFVYFNVDGNDDTCRGVQETYQRTCCMNSLQLTEAIDADHRSLNEKEEVTMPFSRRELQWTIKTNTFSSPSSFGFSSFRAPAPAPRTSSWGFSAPSPARSSSFQQITPVSNSNGMALGCSVAANKSYTTVQVSTPTSSGFSAPRSVNCGTASRSGIGSGYGSMYNVALKCVRCTCCGQCSGLDARVCVGNNQPRAPATNTGWSARSGWRRLMEFLELEA